MRERTEGWSVAAEAFEIPRRLGLGQTTGSLRSDKETGTDPGTSSQVEKAVCWITQCFISFYFFFFFVLFLK
uniref:Uncharacterized protein n=1 Tax=Rhizophora mucronata TaxID=61149 RepID=A0A2P2JWY6_RHIMU